jgi:hypothetical protein
MKALEALYDRLAAVRPLTHYTDAELAEHGTTVEVMNAITVRRCERFMKTRGRAVRRQYARREARERRAELGTIRLIRHQDAARDAAARSRLLPVTSAPSARNESRPREHRSGQTRTSRGSPDDPSDPDPPPDQPQPVADAAAPSGATITIAVSVDAPRPRWEDMPPCETCDSTGWDSLPDEVDDFGHVYSSVRPCPDCERVGSRAAA